MADTDKLRQEAACIRDEVNENANTAQRVGNLLIQMVDALGSSAATGNLTGYVAVDSLDQLPSSPSGIYKTAGYLFDGNLYVFVGKKGDTAGGLYKNCGPFKGPKGDAGAALKFSDLTAEEKKELKGEPGEPGKKGDKGDQGNTGSSVDYPFELVNNLTEGGVEKALTAEQGKILRLSLSKVETNMNQIPVKDSEKNVVNLTGFGVNGSAAGAKEKGDIYYNTSTKLLRRYTASNPDYETVPYEKDTIYFNKSDEKYYEWNGSGMVIAHLNSVAVKDYVDNSINEALGGASITRISEDLGSVRGILKVKKIGDDINTSGITMFDSKSSTVYKGIILGNTGGFTIYPLEETTSNGPQCCSGYIAIPKSTAVISFQVGKNFNGVIPRPHFYTKDKSWLGQKNLNQINASTYNVIVPNDAIYIGFTVNYYTENIRLGDAEFRVTSGTKEISEVLETMTSKINGIEKEYNKVPVRDSIFEITGFGETGSAAGIQTKGEVYYNTKSKLLRRYRGKISPDYETVPYEDGAVYLNLSNGKKYEWNGSDLVITYKEGYTEYKPIKDYIDDEIKDKLGKGGNAGFIGAADFYISKPLKREAMDTYKSTELYQIYDNLLKSHPHYVKREEDLGVDSNGSPIRQYSIRFQNPVFSQAEATITPNLWKKHFDYTQILLISGVHGDEKTASYGLALAIEELVKSKERWANFIKSNCIIKLIPLVNVWGYDHNSRNNKNDVNLNRDAIDFTQSETVAVKNFIDENPDAKIFIDLHNTMGKYAYFEIDETNYLSNKYVTISAQLASLLYEDWRDNLYKDNGQYYPYLYSMFTPFSGLIVSYANKKGKIGHITETPRDAFGGGNVNYLDSCKITKDMIINLLQTYIAL